MSPAAVHSLGISDTGLEVRRTGLGMLDVVWDVRGTDKQELSQDPHSVHCEYPPRTCTRHGSALHPSTSSSKVPCSSHVRPGTWKTWGEPSEAPAWGTLDVGADVRGTSFGIVAIFAGLANLRGTGLCTFEVGQDARCTGLDM